MAKLLRPGGLTAFGANLFQFTGIEPIAAAVGALIDLDPAFGAEIMTMQLDSGAARTIAFARGIHDHLFVALDVQERLAGGFVLLIDAFEFEGIEPNTAAATLAHVHLQTAHLNLL